MARSSRLRRFLLASTAVVLTLAAVELAARVVWLVGESPPEHPKRSPWFFYSRDLGWEPRPGYRGAVFHEAREFDERGLVAGDLRPDARRRVILIGDSCTYGFGVPNDLAFGALLEERLDSTDVVNLGVPGYSSYQGMRRLEKALELAPDLVVVSFSYNDRRYVVDEGDVDGSRCFTRIWWRAQLDQLNHYYTYRSLRWIVVRVLPPRERLIDVRSAPVRVERDQHVANFKRMSDMCSERGVRIVFLLLGENPTSMDWIDDGRASIERGDYEHAASAFKKSMRLNFYEALARRYLAELYTDQGDLDRADEVAVIPPFESLHGGDIVRLEDAYSQAIVELGRTLGVPVCDARLVFAEDPSVFLDAIHFDGRGHQKVAGVLQRFLDENGLLASP